MARNDQMRIDPRQVVDSSQSANVALGVQASTRDVGKGGPMWAVAHALNSAAGSMADEAGQAAIAKAKAKAAQDKKDGESDASAADVTGVAKTAEELNARGQVYTQAYRDTEGERLRYTFEQQVRPQIAALEPGTDINQFLQSKANEFLDANKDMPEETRKSFLTAVSKAQPEWKIEYTKHSITESMQREEENHGAILSGEMTSQRTLTPDMILAMRDKMDASGIHGAKQDDIIIKAVVPALRSGEVNIDEAMKTIDGHFGSGGRVLHDVYREQIDNAAKDGRAAQEKALAKSQEDSLTHVGYMLNDKANAGVLGDKEIDLYRRQYGQTPEWAISLHNRNREARQKADKEAEKEKELARLLNVGLNGDAIHVEGAGYTDVVKAVEKGLEATISVGIQKNDFSQVPRYLVAAGRNNMKLPGFGRIIGGLADPDNPARFAKGYELYKIAQNVTPGYADANLDPKDLATLKAYDRRIEVYHDTPEQAIQAIRAKPDASPEQLSKSMEQFDNKYKPNKPAIEKFDDSHWLSMSPHGATKVSNWGYVNDQIRGYVVDAHKNGQFLDDPAGAMEFGQARFLAEHVQVGDRFEKTYGTIASPAQGAKIGEAMTELGKAWHEKLVASNAIDKEDNVSFAPLPNRPGEWQLFKTHGNVRQLAVQEKEVDGKTVTLPITAKPQEIVGKFNEWSDTEKQKKSDYQHGLNQFGLDGLVTSDSPEAVSKRIDKMMSQDMTTRPGEKYLTPEQVKSAKKLGDARDFVNDPRYKPQSFSDFIQLNH